jgi:ligand-binding sensor domain-containing protein
VAGSVPDWSWVEPYSVRVASRSAYISTAAQQPAYIYRHLTEHDGLASNNVMSIQQDKAGFMWFATDNGLQRYDGARFRIWHHDPADTASIPSDLCGVFSGTRRTISGSSHPSLAGISSTRLRAGT